MQTHLLVQIKILDLILLIPATGGTITTDGDFKVHTFTSSGNFVVSSVQGLGEVKILLVGGGVRGGSGHVAGGYPRNAGGYL